MALQVTFKKRARKGLSKMPIEIQNIFYHAFEDIAEENKGSCHDIQKLTNRPGYRLRILSWRAIYTIEDNELEVLDTGHRSSIYKNRRK